MEFPLMQRDQNLAPPTIISEKSELCRKSAISILQHKTVSKGCAVRFCQHSIQPGIIYLVHMAAG